jgi:CRISPR-associated protein Csm4
MKLKYCQFTFKTPFHLGEREGWLEGSQSFVRSDTLFSAICHGFRLLYGEEGLASLLPAGADTKSPLLLSSAFPWWGDKHYLPIPKNQFSPGDKKLKKALFADKTSWEKMIAGNPPDAGMDLLNPSDESSLPWKTYEVPRVGLSRRNNSPEDRFFYQTLVEYQPDAGLYFFYHWETEEKEILLDAKFKAALRLLADEGLGGDRTSGKGWMEMPQFKEMELAVPRDADGIIMLSLYHPLIAEYGKLGNGYYDLIERRGYIYSPDGCSLQKRPVRMFTEGSVFPCQDSELKGSLAEITPDSFHAHRVYRYGKAFGIPCNFSQKGVK